MLPSALDPPRPEGAGLRHQGDAGPGRRANGRGNELIHTFRQLWHLISIIAHLKTISCLHGKHQLLFRCATMANQEYTMANQLFEGQIQGLRAFQCTEDSGERLSRLFELRSQLIAEYGPKYNQINALLSEARALGDGLRPPTPDAVTAIVKAVNDIRTQVVLFFKILTSQVEFAINELVAGTFPVPENPPTQSDDLDALYAIGGSIVGLGGAIALIPGGQVVGAGVIAFGAGFTLGVAAADLLD